MGPPGAWIRAASVPVGFIVIGEERRGIVALCRRHRPGHHQQRPGLRRYRRRRGEEPALVHLPIPQVVQPGVVEERPLLPSFLYLPGPNELPAGSLQLPWAPDRDYAVGEFARNQGSQVPTRLVSSAKSWLCHPGIDRRRPVLPWKAPENGRRVSPLEASTYYLQAPVPRPGTT